MVKKFQDWEPMKTNKLVPKLRFPEFTDEWEIKVLGEIADRISKKNFNFAVEKVLTNSALDGVVEQSSFFESKITTKGNLDNYFILDFGDFVYNPRISKFAPVGPISRNNIEKGIVSPLYFVFRFKNSHTDYYDYYFHTMLWHVYIKASANKGARFDRISISAEKFMGIPIPYPSQQEQQKIADCLASLDELLDLEEKKLSALQKYKKGLLQKIFSQEIRFKDDNGNNFPDWKETLVNNVVKLIPAPYKLQTVECLKCGTYPVIDQGQKAIIGYTNNKNYLLPLDEYVLFGDHTRIIKYCNFSFAQGADGLKILKVNNFLSTRFLYYNLLNLTIPNKGYARHWSFVKDSKIALPSIQEQQKIADFLSSVDELIENQELKIEQFKQHKKGLLQGLFPNINGVEDVN